MSSKSRKSGRERKRRRKARRAEEARKKREESSAESTPEVRHDPEEPTTEQLVSMARKMAKTCFDAGDPKAFNDTLRTIGALERVELARQKTGINIEVSVESDQPESADTGRTRLARIAARLGYQGIPDGIGEGTVVDAESVTPVERGRQRVPKAEGSGGS